MRGIPVSIAALALLAMLDADAAPPVQVSSQSQAQSRSPSQSQSAVDIALRLLDHLDAGDFAAAESGFDPAMRQAVPADRLAAVWKSLPPAAGRGRPELRSVDGATLVAVPLRRGDAELVAQVVVGADGAIRGFLVRPAAPPKEPAPAPDAAFVEREATVGHGAAALPATLALPRGAGPFAAVVLVHGSGPQDRPRPRSRHARRRRAALREAHACASR